MNHPNRLVTLCAGFVGLCAPALAGSGFDLTPSDLKPSAPPSSDAWRFTLKPYFWAAGISGDVQLGNLPSADVDISFSDIMDNFDIGGMLALEAREGDGDVAYLVDLLYVKLEDDGTNVDVTMTEFMGEFDVALRPWEPKWLEGLIGMRYWNVYGLVDPTGPPRASKAVDWVDPIIGARTTFHPFGERWTSQWRGDFGGFDVGSKSTYQFMGDIQYAFTESLNGAVGYRTLNIDYEGDSGDYDLTMSGPWAGVNWSF